MSLHVLANHMASKGRGEDSMLVHMTPEEVASLQTLAMKNGGSLSINPDTGLPEAGFLKKLLPMIAGLALGPAGFGLMSAGMAGLTVGGITSLATGSLSKGLMAGLGAYGGAGLGEAIAGAGTGALSSEVGKSAIANAGLTGEAALGAQADQIAQEAISSKLSSATPFDKLGAGFNAVTQDPAALGNFAKDNWKMGLAAASPIIADAMVPTAVKVPAGSVSPGYIRPFQFDENTRTVTAQTPVLASEWGSRDFPDYIRKTQMADGGIVAFADGGVSGSGSLDLHVPINLGGGEGGGGGGFDGGYTPIGSNGSVGNMNPNAGGNGFGGLAGLLGGVGVGSPATFGNANGQVSGKTIDELMAMLQQQQPQQMDQPYGGINGRNEFALAGRAPDGIAYEDDSLYKSLLRDRASESDARMVGGDKSMFADGGMARGGATRPFYSKETGKYSYKGPQVYADGGEVPGYALGGLGSLGGYSDGGRLLKGPGDGVSDSIPATIGSKQQPARLADGEFVVPARIVSELGNGSTDAGARKLYAMMDRIQKARGKTVGKGKVAANPRADKHLPA
jgi:hypothetical protein